MRADRPPTEATAADEDSRRRADRRVPWRIFVALGAFVGLTAVIYGATSKEHAGTAMLTVASILGLWCGVFLWRNTRRFESPGEAGSPDGDGTAYLPDASPWPVGIGVGLALTLNGLLVGIWFLVPGVMVLGLSLAGFARQSRHRW